MMIILLRVVGFIIGMVLAFLQFYIITHIRKKSDSLWQAMAIVFLFILIIIGLALLLVKVDLVTSVCLAGGFAVGLNSYAIFKFIKFKTGER